MYSVNITCATGSKASVVHKMPEVPPPAGSKRATQVHLTLYQGAVTCGTCAHSMRQSVLGLYEHGTVAGTTLVRRLHSVSNAPALHVGGALTDLDTSNLRSL